MSASPARRWTRSDVSAGPVRPSTCRHTIRNQLFASPADGLLRILVRTRRLMKRRLGRDTTAALTVDHHTIAAIALSGTALNLLGGLYLAYDLFGGRHGPLRTLTRGVTYGVLFFLGYVVFLPVRFSALAALGTGLTLAIEFARAARGARATRAHEALSSLVRGACYGVGSALLFGWRFGVSFGVLSTIGQIFAYWRGFTPTLGLDARRQWRKHLI